MFDGNSSGQDNSNSSGSQPPFEGDPKESKFSFGRQRTLRQLKVGDPEIITALLRAGVDGPTTLSLVWGWEMGHRPTLFPKRLIKTVLAIEEHTKKKEEAYNMQECRLHGIILELLQIIYEKQANDIVDIILKK